MKARCYLLAAATVLACGTDAAPNGTDAAAPVTDGAAPADGTPDGSQGCVPGSRGCDCASGLCRTGLRCEDNVCLGDTQSDAGKPQDGDTGAPCGDTSSDPRNCGACGHVCETGVCESGQCGNAWSDCFVESDGFGTCSEVCAGAGESCVAAGCDQDATLRVWGGASQSRCELNSTPGYWDARACDATLTWGGSSTYKRCCCTDSE